MLTYILIFVAKIVENCLSTLRLILVANGKKLIGAILQGIVTLVWLFSAATVIINITDDLWKILFFVLGSFVGSYLGSLLEEKIAFGTNLLMVITSHEKENIIKKKIRHNVAQLIKKIDNKAIIFTEKIIVD